MMTKVCSKCKAEKLIDYFYNCKNKKDGLYSSCKDCVDAKVLIWRTANPEKVVAYQASYQKKYSITHTEKRALYSKQYYRDNVERLYAYVNAWKTDNPEKVAASADKWVKNNREKINARRKLAVVGLTDSYINELLKIKNPPQELIELKRVQLLITRELRNKSCQL